MLEALGFRVPRSTNLGPNAVIEEQGSKLN